nr:unnamed protein product [Callosobruchus chinensis]
MILDALGITENDNRQHIPSIPDAKGRSAGRQLKLRNTSPSIVLPCAEEEARIWKLSRRRKDRMSRGMKILQILDVPAPDAQNTSTRQREFGMETAVFNEAINNDILFMEEQVMIEDNTSTAHKICDRHEENAGYSSISREDILPDLMKVKNCDDMDKTETTSKSYIQPEQDFC